MLTTVQVDPVFGYGLGIFSIRTVCGTIWGHNGGVAGYNSFASNSRDGKRNLVMMVSAEPDAQTGPLLDLALNTATCNMFGQNVNDQAMESTVPLLRTKNFDSFLN
jgi:D-alanyl-D-alanine carboxypeptidase